MTTIIRYTTLSGEWDNLKTLIQNNKTEDDRECQAAARMADGNWSCEDIEGLERLKNEKFQEVDRELGEVNGLITAYQAKDVAQDLLDKSQKWGDVKTDLDQLHADVKAHQELDTWKGEAAEGYKALLPTQLKALLEMSGLATSQGRACNQMSLINASLFKLTHEAIISLIDRLGMIGPAVYNDAAKTIRGDNYMDAYYCERSYAAVPALQGFKTWLTRQKALSTADWANSANLLDGDLNTITSSGTVNLLPGGKWPGIGKIVEADAARTGTAGSPYGPTIGGNSSTGDGGYVDLN